MDTQTNTDAGATNAGSAPIKPADQRTPMGILAYLGPLVIVSYLVAKDDPFVKFHIKQGFVLMSIELATYVLGMFFWPLWIIFRVVDLATLILSIVGIVNVTKGEEKQLPLVGSFASYFNI